MGITLARADKEPRAEVSATYPLAGTTPRKLLWIGPQQLDISVRIRLLTASMKDLLHLEASLCQTNSATLRD